MEKLNNLLSRLYEASNNDTCMSLIYLIQQIKNATNKEPNVTERYEPLLIEYDSEGRRIFGAHVPGGILYFMYKGKIYKINFARADHAKFGDTITPMDQIRIFKIDITNMEIDTANMVIESNRNGRIIL